MYDVKPNLIIGFHGCDADVCKALLNNPNHIKISKKPYDWLGHGMYFWENNYERAFKWANDKKKRRAIKQPAVIGALLQLGRCCDFTETKYTQMIADYYEEMVKTYRSVGFEPPHNQDIPSDKHKDRILRALDCAAIEFMHARLSDETRDGIAKRKFSESKYFDSIRGVFTEGGPVFEGAGIFEKTHIKLCIRNPNCIKGFFLPCREIDFQPPLSL